MPFASRLKVAGKSSDKIGQIKFTQAKAMEYILFIHNNTDLPATAQWDAFFAAANQSGLFLGGSEIAGAAQIGSKGVRATTDSVAGFMRFEAEDVSELHQLLALHPVYLQGGTLELCAMPQSS
ncbi:hypothetical protein [Halopseudomonas maritima]|uniref:hypothetical protein n=1 Tax=Halopseudomonas maritima TaxID=2918528 RepID=UPI001EEB1E5C|nr:hypothetical protein [Halopseudomonas maritima]UJJ31948.1 hypothetical protein HV822_01875 [Halopseudomonas maritima]